MPLAHLFRRSHRGTQGTLSAVDSTYVALSSRLSWLPSWAERGSLAAAVSQTGMLT